VRVSLKEMNRNVFWVQNELGEVIIEVNSLITYILVKYSIPFNKLCMMGVRTTIYGY